MSSPGLPFFISPQGIWSNRIEAMRLRTISIFLIVLMLPGSADRSASAASDPAAQESFLNRVEEALWIQKHHGVIIFQDRSSDCYDFPKLIALAKELGTDSVKTWLKGEDPGEIPRQAKSPKYRELFDSFGTVCLNVCPEYILSRWDCRQGYGSRTGRDVRSDFYKLTEFLIDTYDGRGKTFIINYFFEMNVYMGTDPSGRPDFPVLAFVADAQKGVHDAIAEFAISDIRILDSVEANCDHDTFHFVKNFFPRINVDLYSLSFYGFGSVESHTGYWGKHAPDNGLFGKKNVMVGEYGMKMEDSRAHGDEEIQRQYLKATRDAARRLDVPYIFHFWLADQDSKAASEGHFGLVDLKGRKRKAWHDLRNAYWLGKE